MRIFPRLLAFTVALSLGARAPAQDAEAGDADHGKVRFQQSCAICHADAAGQDGAVVVKQGPSLVDVFGRKAATGPIFKYSPALTNSGLTWDAPTLNTFLTNPAAMVPGTNMPITVAQSQDRLDLIAYLKTLHGPDPGAAAETPPTPAASMVGNIGDWTHAAPGMKYHYTLAGLPPPFASTSAGNGPYVVPRPEGAAVSVPRGFTARIFAVGLSNPRVLRIAPNGDIFLAETGANRVRVMRAADGADSPTQNEVYAADLDRPFGIAFYPPGDHPKWVYVANNNSVVRFAYTSGDLKAQGPPETIVPKLCDSGGGHSTRDVAFSLDGKRMFISVGSGSNVAEGISTKSPVEIKAWEAEHGFGATWDEETNRADILVTDPEGHAPLHPYATGIRNGVGIAVNKTTGDLWTSTNERDGLGDDLVPDYITRVKEGGYYGWPWYYLGNHEDPRRTGERPDLAGKAIVPDVLLQSHSASLEMCFYTATTGVAAFPADFVGDAFAALHGSWNRSVRTGYKIIRVRVNHGVPTGVYEDFLTGYVADNTSVWGRPAGVAVAHDGALLVTEDGNGTMLRISYAAGH